MSRKELPDLLPLTTAQRGLWMAQYIAPPGSSFNIAEALYLDGDIDEELFLRSLYEVRHEIAILRSRIFSDSENLYLTFISDDVTFPLIDMSNYPDPDTSAWDWMQKETRKPTDITTQSLWKNALIRLGHQRYVWFHCGHHIVLDGFTGGLVAARVAQVYSARAEGREPGLSEYNSPEVLSEQERIYGESRRYEADKEYWRRELTDLPEPVSLSVRPHKPLTGENGGELAREISLSAESVERITEVGKAYGGSLPQTLTALLAAYIFLVTEQNDLVVGMPVSARVNRILRKTPGMVANGIVLRFHFDEGITFSDLVQQSRSVMMRALRHQLFRYEELRRNLGLLETGQHITRLGINIEPFNYRLAFGECVARNRNISNGSMQDLTFFVFDRQDGRGLVIQADANPALYTAEELDAHLERIRLMVNKILERPGQCISSVTLVSAEEEALHAAEEEAAVRLWPDNDAASLLMQSLDRKGHESALIDCDGTVSSRFLYEEAEHLAKRLKAAGLAPGHLVAVALPRDRRMVVALLAILKAGCAWVAIDTESPRGRAAVILEEANPALVIIGDHELTSWFDGYAVLVLSLDKKEELPITDLSGAAFSVPPQTAYVSFTSGTTGRPKGVVVPCSALYNLLLSMTETVDFTKNDRLLAVTGLTFDISVLELLMPVVAGGCVVVATHADVRNPHMMVQKIHLCGVTFLQATPTLYKTFTGSGLTSALCGLTLLTGGEALSPGLASELFANSHAVFNVYGPTETTIWSTAYRLTAESCANPPVGRPLANTSLFIVNRDGNALPDGVTGELLIAGAGVATGYLNRPDLTQERFIVAPSGERAYRTGDRAVRTADGLVWLSGRADDQVKIRGMRIETGEVESVLMQLPGVRQAAVLAEKSADDMTTVLVACLVADQHDSVVIRRQISEKLPAQMVPGRIVYVDHLPRTSAGKLDRRMLKALTPKEEIFSEKVLPRTHEEKILAGIWAELLHVTEVDIHTSFFSMGGDSLMVLQMVARLSELGYELPVGQIFTEATVVALAPFLAGKGEAADPLSVVLPLRPQGEGAPVFCIHPVLGVSWSFKELVALLPSEHPVYALQDAGLLLNENSPETVEELIDIYLDEILKIHPHGPYCFVGWSMGGVIAHGLSAQLRARGEQIQMLAMLDSYPFEESHRNITLASEENVRLALQFLDIRTDPDRPEPKTAEEVAALFLEGIDISQIPQSAVYGQKDQSNLAKVFLQVTLRNMAMLQKYIPCKSDTDILFIRAAAKGGDASEGVRFDNPEQWKNYTSGRVMICEQAARHQDMLKTGNIEKISFILNDYLKKSRDEGGGVPYGFPLNPSDSRCAHEVK
ncbi:amino acid adenylation domain-containing protein [Acetobacter thailandicus]|uniref:amino acid adenylation domain-containing protein n=1 Tax=Acetobacter thailandicus TaxID=1502842 RepID=UPI001BA9EF0E|nr:non-ribosomal peptide synthetase [Acetobacter thailandicus]MBS1002295.1 amino acid adenylation domain-containing protein [Acetobacter thailandicus]